ncbi:type II toxin-antitoxin system RelB/DinJ family antitoxin [Bifidobacterium avesanii]|uniref:Type II toxin-antitoxin system RelB/DinJ family antitoxin n=1 Tax=Bifidobacterium avesanii TaxID=1798157 RepID=A0A7K3TJT8_9BIFI|nr:type II toxin-antitoxin system RelB/DinJ family antitoxin [Bifidobacterium avesanii]KAB8286682.1 RelB/DinJ family addiction module antitoxin [Bifidobacterium avesanii]NEG79375.1 type II toxin-antitoxin system RelB/DinJ family antitoxin [Bifidobacterium avesanii]
MATAMVNVRLDEQTKKDMGELCSELGMSMSTAFNMFAKAMVRERRIPFEVTADPFYSAENMRRLERSAAQMDAGMSSAHDLIGE